MELYLVKHWEGFTFYVLREKLITANFWVFYSVCWNLIQVKGLVLLMHCCTPISVTVAWSLYIFYHLSVGPPHLWAAVHLVSWEDSLVTN